MADTEQVNVRVPAADKNVVHHIARFLREEPRAGERLMRFIKGGEASAVQRLDALEVQVASLEGVLRDFLSDEYEDPVEPQPVAAAMPLTIYTKGTGRSRRMTPAGKGAVIAMHQVGRDFYAIAAEVGVSWQAVRGFLKRNGVAA